MLRIPFAQKSMDGFLCADKERSGRKRIIGHRRFFPGIRQVYTIDTECTIAGSRCPLRACHPSAAHRAHITRAAQDAIEHKAQLSYNHVIAMSNAPIHSHGIEIDMRRAARHHTMMGVLADVYRRQGYAPYNLPLIDSYDGYSAALGDDHLQRSFRFVNSDGTLVLLRPDLTLFLTRHVAHTLERRHLPLRLWYSDSVLRNHPRDGGAAAQYQSGVELIGQAGDDVEIELLALLHRALSSLGLTDSVIHIGSRRLVRTVLAGGAASGAGVAAGDATAAHEGAIINAVADRREWELPRLLTKRGYSKAEARQLTALLMYIGNGDSGGVDAIPQPKLVARRTMNEIRSEIERLRRISAAVAGRGGISIHIDLSEIGEQRYYTGAVFAAYHPHIAEKIAGGGRYDTLFGAYGFDTTSAGFTIFLHHCEQQTETDDTAEGADTESGAAGDGNGNGEQRQ